MSEKFINTFDGTKLFLKKEVVDNSVAICVIVHGLCEHQGRYDYVASQMHANNIGTYRFDHRGHGRSEGERTYYADFNEIVDDVNVVVDLAIAENPEKPIFVLGHSMGGFAVTLFGAKYPDKKIRGIITSGALTEDNTGLITGLPTGMDPHEKLPNELGAGVCSVPEVVEAYGLDEYNTKTFTAGLFYALVAGLRWFKSANKQFTYPIFMLHGENDGLVSEQDTFNTFKNISSQDRQMKIYGGLYHEVLNEYCRDEVIADVLGWISQRI